MYRFFHIISEYSILQSLSVGMIELSEQRCFTGVFKMTKTTDSKLAILGGEALCSKPVNAIPWPPVDDETAEQLKQVYLSRNWSFGGPEEMKFNQEFAKFHDAEYAISMANGTVTLECALHALCVGRGDEVIVPAYTWMATAMAARYVGAQIVFVDVEPDTLCMNPKKFEAAITDKTKAVIPVHILGSMADMEAILAIAKKHNIYVIEDCAHMQGGKWNGKGVGSWGHVGSFSFQQSKTLASGEGGICITNDADLADKIARIKHIGYPVGAKQGAAMTGPQAGLICHNYRSTEFQAVILRGQLKHLPELLEKYSSNAKYLAELTKDIPGIRLQKPGRLATRQGYYGLAIMFDEGELAKIDKEIILKAINKEGIACLYGVYGPVYKHILFNLPQSDWRIAGDCSVTDITVDKHTLSFPHQALGVSRNDIEIIADVLRKVANNAGELIKYQSENQL